MEAIQLPPESHRDPPHGDAPNAGLRLVRVRLALALFTAAVLPLVLIAPVARVIGAEGRAQTSAQMSDEAIAIAGRLTATIEDLGRTLVQEAANPSVRTLLTKPSLAAKSQVSDRLAALVARVPFIVAAAVVKPNGEDALRIPASIEVPPSATEAEAGHQLMVAAGSMPAGQLVISRPESVRATESTVTVVLGLSAVAQQLSPGAIRVVISLPALLAAAAGSATPATQTVALINESDAAQLALLVAKDGGAIVDQAVGRVLDPATALESNGRAPLSLPGFDPWVVVIAAPFAVSSVPIPHLAALLVLCLALGVVILWMGGRVLAPARALEASRTHLGGLYEAERAVSLLDHLTGLGNHRAFQEELAGQFDTIARYGGPLALLTFDLDEFKQVNDNLGHAVGDDMLAEVGRLTRESARSVDGVFRTGGDEFAVIMPHTDAAGARDFGNRLLRLALSDRVSGRYRRPISLSAGIAVAPVQARDKLELQGRADAALYRSKRAGRTLVTVFDPSIDRAALDDSARAKLSARVTHVARTRSLTAVYQPIVHVETGRPIAWEGLVRPSPDTGFDSPTALFLAAEATGRIVEIDRACLEVVASGARAMPRENLVSLNISPRTFESPEFNASGLLTLLERVGVEPRQVILELTEREPIEDLDRLQKALNACRAAGMQISADDVGAGNAGLRMLSQIQFDVMKIDLSLVQVAAGREPVTSVLTSLIGLGRRWGALVVAEGVETPEHLRMIRGLGVDAAQGYLIARPGPLDLAARYDMAALAELDAPNLMAALARAR